MRDKPQTHILAICGPAPRFPHAKLLRAAAMSAPVGCALFEWAGLGSVPSFSEDDEATPVPVVVSLRDAIATADAVPLRSTAPRCPASSRMR